MRVQGLSWLTEHIVAGREIARDVDLVDDDTPRPITRARALDINVMLPWRLGVPAVVPAARRVELTTRRPDRIAMWRERAAAPAGRLAGRRVVKIDARDRVHGPHRAGGARARLDEDAPNGQPRAVVPHEGLLLTIEGEGMAAEALLRKRLVGGAQPIGIACADTRTPMHTQTHTHSWSGQGLARKGGRATRSRRRGLSPPP